SAGRRGHDRGAECAEEADRDHAIAAKDRASEAGATRPGESEGLNFLSRSLLRDWSFFLGPHPDPPPCGGRGKDVARNLVCVVFDPQVTDIYSRLLDEGIVFLRGEIDDDVAIGVTAQLLFLATEAPERDIHLYINSPGGSLSA